ncbi:MAG: aldo/keto reductase [Leptospirales bacterium]|nr:aldo/keto reductase [Leptospirales bacterium]
MLESLSRIALGTVQFGMAYGVASAGQVRRDEVAQILGHAWDKGIRALDTAVAYGESETVLGEIGVSGWTLTTKLSAVPVEADPESFMREAAESSLRRLRVSSIHALLMHNPAQLLNEGGDRIFRALAKLRDEKLVSRVGVSVIRAEEAIELCSRFDLDVVQAAMNIFDRRMEASGALRVLKDAHAEVQIRSVFLQGLLLMDSQTRPAKFDRFQSAWQRWDEWLKEKGTTALSACLSFALQIPGADRIVLGVDSLRHLREIIASVPSKDIEIPQNLAYADATLLDPWKWGEF